MTGLPKAIIKKYGVTKKAWSVFRSTSHSRSNKTASRRTKHRGYSMAKRRSFSRRSSRSSGGKFKPLMDAAISGAIVGAAFKYAPAQYNTPITRIGVGGAAAYFGSGYIKEAGKVLLAFEAANQTGKLLSGSPMTLTASQTTNAGGFL